MSRSLDYKKTTTVRATVTFKEWEIAGHPFRVVTRAAGLEGLNQEADSRLRSYEIEERLEERYGGFWVVGEWCPFDGIFTRWRSFAPAEVIESTVQWWEEHRVELKADGRNVDYCIAHLRGKRDPAEQLAAWERARSTP